MCRVGGGSLIYAEVKRGHARREHQCYECKRAILIGEPFEHHWCVYESGRASKFKVCSHCAVLCEWLAQNCEGWIWGEVVEDIEEHGRDYLRNDLVALGACARVGWVKGPSFRKPYPGIPIPTLPPLIGVEARPVT
jgi:hypothetical protein